MESNSPKCPRCGAAHPWKNGQSAAGAQVWRCRDCGRTWREAKARTGPKPRPNAREVAQEKLNKFRQRIRQADGDRLSVSELRAGWGRHLDRVERGDEIEITCQRKVRAVLRRWESDENGRESDAIAAVSLQEFHDRSPLKLKAPLVTIRNGIAIALVPVE